MMLQLVPADELHPGDELHMFDWTLHVTDVVHAAVIAVDTAELGFPLHFDRDVAVLVDR